MLEHRLAEPVFPGPARGRVEADTLDGEPRAVPVSALKRETLVLTLPADPDLARLTGLVSAHFFRQNGVGAAAARRGARSVVKACRGLLRAAARSSRQIPTLVLLLETRDSFLEVIGRAGAGRRTSLVRIERPEAPRGMTRPA